MNGPQAYLRAVTLLAEVEEDGFGPHSIAKVQAALAYATAAQAAAAAVSDEGWSLVAAPAREVVEITEETPLELYASLPIGSIVQVIPFGLREYPVKRFYGKVMGYDLHRSKYRVSRQVKHGFGDDCFATFTEYFFPKEVQAFDPDKPQRIQVVLEVDAPRSFKGLGEDQIAEMACAELETGLETDDSDLGKGDLLRVRTVSWKRP